MPRRVVGIVIVSHSADLASGLADLARQVAGPEVRIEPAGGGADGGLGTDGGPRARRSSAPRPATASSSSATWAARSSPSATCSSDGNGVVRLADAPLVEGAVAAAVVASAARSSTTWSQAAEEARGAASSETLVAPDRRRPPRAARRRVRAHGDGVHARIVVGAGDREADAKSLLSVLALGAKGGTTLRLRADGDDAARRRRAPGCVAGLREPHDRASAARPARDLVASEAAARARAAGSPRGRARGPSARLRRRGRRRRSARRRPARRAAAARPGRRRPRRRPRSATPGSCAARRCATLRSTRGSCAGRRPRRNRSHAQASRA